MAMTRGHSRHSWPRDKGIPVKTMREWRMTVAHIFENGKWRTESKKANTSTIGKTIKKMHKKKRRQWERSVENGSRSG